MLVVKSNIARQKRTRKNVTHNRKIKSVKKSRCRNDRKSGTPDKNV